MAEEDPSLNAAIRVKEYLQDFERKIEKLLAQVMANLGRGYFSLKSAADYSDLSQKTLQRFISEGRLKAYRPARGKVLIKKKELDALIDQSTHQLRRGRGIRR